MIHRAGDVGHFVHFYEDDRFALENIGRLASRRMAAGDSGVFVATSRIWRSLKKSFWRAASN